METRPYAPGAPFVIDSLVRAPGWSMPYLHYHDSYELYFLEKGTHNILVGDRLFGLSEQDVALFRPNVLHKSHNTNGYTRTAIYFTQSFLETYFNDRAVKTLTRCFEKPVISLDKEVFTALRRKFALIRSEDQESEENLIFVYLSEILTALCQNMNSFQPVRLSPDQERMSAILQYVNENFHSIDSLEEVADKFYITKYHLCRIFKAFTGLTLVEYMNHVKIQHACEMLRSTDKTVTQIGMDCGFNSPMYFSKAFQKIIHMSPREFRKLQ